MMRNTTARWGWMAKTLHWAGAALIFALLAHGWWMVSFPPRAERFAHYEWHASVGYGLIALMVARVVWRWANAVPGLPHAMPVPLRLAAVAGHWGLYLLALASAVSGWALAGTFRRPLDLTLFGSVRVPALVASQDRALHEQLESLHAQLAWALAILIVVHLLGVWYHWRLNDGIARRMFNG